MDEDRINEEQKLRAADGFAKAAIVMGIISLFSTFCCCPFVFSALGIIFALLSKGAEKVLRDQAKTGLILSIIGMVVSVVLTIFTIVFPVVMMKTSPEYKTMIMDTYEENESTFRQIYGDETYDQMLEYIENF